MSIYWWIDDLKVGDVLRAPSGALRIVRSVTRRGNDAYLKFTIRHCSWTRRCYTCYGARELARIGYCRVAHVTKLKGPLDPEIQRNIEDHRIRTLKCCDVRGVA